LQFEANPRQIVQETLSRKYPTQKKMAGGVAQGVGPELKSQYCKKKKSHSEKAQAALVS
jgi:hypothetical protein